jgi:DNA-directed RNA polymerase subunit RPC12/RpoP
MLFRAVLHSRGRQFAYFAAELYPREIPILKRLVEAIDTQNNALLAQTMEKIKAEVDALIWPIPTILPSLVDMLADELAGKQNQIRCPICDGRIPILKMDFRFAARYTCPHCGNDVVLADPVQ